MTLTDPTAGRSSDAQAAAGAAASRFTMPATVEQVLLAASLFFALAANRPFLSLAMHGHDRSDPSTWGFAVAVVVWLAALHFIVMAVVANRWTMKPLVGALIVASALASFYMGRYGIQIDTTMMRNVLHTDVAEARELLSPSLVPHLLLYAVLPLLLLWRVRLVPRPWSRAIGVRMLALLVAAAVLGGALLVVFQSFASLLRNHHEARHLITPVNVVSALLRVAARDLRGGVAERLPIGLDAAPGPMAATRPRPLLFVLVVGETARAANWGLSGYARQTTPQLARLPVINFPHVSSCGTSTEVSLPCMFAPVGRRDYDEARIRHSEGLLHVLNRAGVAVHWRDNQSGCKGVCDGLPGDTVQALVAPGLCDDHHCLDEGLLQGLDRRIADAHGTQVLVLHPLGNHGPSYFRRYPAAMARFKPACESDDLQSCTREQIVNAYDNALLYTDHVLARLIATLAAQADRVDSVVLYVSDHGESLGEKGLFLHGMPYPIAPEVQTHVPMVMWLSARAPASLGLDAACLRQQADRPLGHDHLFHTVLGLLDVHTALYERAWDFSAACRAQSMAAAR